MLDNKAIMSTTDLMNYLNTYELPHPNENESHVFQRIKLFAKRCNGFIKFNIVDEQTNTYIIYSTHTPCSDDSINAIFPYRSILIHQVNGEMKVLNYSIRRITQITNREFIDKYNCIKNSNDYVCHESYEGPIMVAHKINNMWTLRTTSCINAFTSFYDGKMSHGDQFDQVCKIQGHEGYVDALDKLEREIPNAYFVFLLVTPGTRHLCRYTQNNGCALYLLHARDENDVHIDVTTQATFSVPVKKTYDEVVEGLATNIGFNNDLLDLQGYIITYPDGSLYKTYTMAYEQGLGVVPHYDGFILNALHMYNKKVINTFFNMHGVDDPSRYAIVGDIHTIHRTISNLMAYMFITFTKLVVTKQPNQNVKSYTKINGELFALVNEGNSHNYIAALTHLQSKCRAPTMFNDMKLLCTDVNKCLKQLDPTVYNNMIKHYASFKTFLNECVAKIQNVRPFTNNLDEQFNAVMAKWFN